MGRNSEGVRSEVHLRLLRTSKSFQAYCYVCLDTGLLHSTNIDDPSKTTQTYFNRPNDPSQLLPVSDYHILLPSSPHASSIPVNPRNATDSPRLVLPRISTIDRRNKQTERSSPFHRASPSLAEPRRASPGRFSLQRSQIQRERSTQIGGIESVPQLDRNRSIQLATDNARQNRVAFDHRRTPVSRVAGSVPFAGEFPAERTPAHCVCTCVRTCVYTLVR